ncbi:uncharacterized protein LOC112559716 [Pomacea canaliculata]|uniref:uncharacterized protein LOC112559716 n=1 Tax=Pomacea canaliculata TaxID=400727 RepID=UPI000D737B44|nr:uncharacterized protein LOC112559716 [Pomacea canaliculata]
MEEVHMLRTCRRQLGADMSEPADDILAVAGSSSPATRSFARPLWAVTHPDHWTIAEVGQWVEHVADEYHLSSEVKVALADAFVDVDGKRLMAMTLQDYRQRHEEYGAVLFYVYRRLTCKGQVEPDVWSRVTTLTPVVEDDIHRLPCAHEIHSQATERGEQFSTHEAHPQGSHRGESEHECSPGKSSSTQRRKWSSQRNESF